jgi:SAM-dependent methyltransferase
MRGKVSRVGARESIGYLAPRDEQRPCAMIEKLLRVLGWRALLLTGDPTVLDRWLWLRRGLLPGHRRTFDAGCGNGAFSIYAASRGNEVVAASFSEREQDAAKRRAEAIGVPPIDFRVLDLREIERHRGELGQFDQIICLETIEHVSDDTALVGSLAQMLKPGGRLLLSTPFVDHHPLHTEDPDPSPVEDGLHVRFGYSRARLRELMEGAGLEPVQESFASGVFSQKVTNVMRRLSLRFGRPLAWLVVLPLRALVLVDGPLTRASRYPFLSITVRAVRR